ncbi:MAG: NAD(P)H-dependent oxidoreductase, partial [Geminicoccaceae bacterium]
MKVLLVVAHPEPRSLGGTLREVAVAELAAQGHAVQVSDLYAMGWKPQLDRADFPSLDEHARLRVAAASGAAFATGAQTTDVAQEQAKLLWADVLLLLFPL